MTDNELLAQYIGLEPRLDNGEDCYLRLTFCCWKEDFRPIRYKHQMKWIARKFLELNPKQKLDFDDVVTLKAIVKIVLGQERKKLDE